MIATGLTAMFGLRLPIVLAPMGAVSGGALAAAVSNAGGLGLVGGGYGDAAWLKRELDLVQAQTPHPWGVGFITWSVQRAVVDLALEHRPDAVMLSFGDPGPYAAAIRQSGAMLICQVQDLDGARRALDVGADVIVAQGTEGGGHGGHRATLPFVPAVVDLASPTPVVAAGGIADGRGLAAALMLGAQGALLGTRFYASKEALGRDAAKRRIVEARGDETARTRVFDVVRRLPWPQEFPGRAVRNAFFARWHGREAELDGASAEHAAYRDATARGDFDTAMVWAGEAVDLIREVEAAGALVERIGAEAAAALRRGASLIHD
jgi:nitronate monooxygenase